MINDQSIRDIYLANVDSNHSEKSPLDLPSVFFAPFTQTINAISGVLLRGMYTHLITEESCVWSEHNGTESQIKLTFVLNGTKTDVLFKLFWDTNEHLHFHVFSKDPSSEKLAESVATLVITSNDELEKDTLLRNPKQTAAHCKVALFDTLLAISNEFQKFVNLSKGTPYRYESPDHINPALTFARTLATKAYHRCLDDYFIKTTALINNLSIRQKMLGCVFGNRCLIYNDETIFSTALHSPSNIAATCHVEKSVIMPLWGYITIAVYNPPSMDITDLIVISISETDDFQVLRDSFDFLEGGSLKCFREILSDNNFDFYVFPLSPYSFSFLKRTESWASIVTEYDVLINLLYGLQNDFVEFQSAGWQSNFGDDIYFGSQFDMFLV